MLRSVRAGGLAAALFAILLGAPQVQAQTTSGMFQRAVLTTATVPAQVAQQPAVPATPPAPAPMEQVDPATLRGQPLDQLAAALASAETTDATHECLAIAVYFEARGEPLVGQLAVAEVVLNRAGSGKYPPDVCAVVKQPWQFSFVHKGQFPQADRSSDAWKRAVAVARVAQNRLAYTLPSGVLWYHASYVAPTWGKRLTRQAKIGLHIFYS